MEVLTDADYNNNEQPDSDGTCSKSLNVDVPQNKGKKGIMKMNFMSEENISCSTHVNKS
jgi:U3 small nucleolar RNA-associated protein 14